MSDLAVDMETSRGNSTHGPRNGRYCQPGLFAANESVTQPAGRTLRGKFCAAARSASFACHRCGYYRRQDCAFTSAMWTIGPDSHGRTMDDQCPSSSSVTTAAESPVFAADDFLSSVSSVEGDEQ